MYNNKSVSSQLCEWISREEKFCDLILAPDGNFFVDPQLEERTEWFLLYYNGNICVRPSGNLYCLGALPSSYLIFPVYLGETAIYFDDETRCTLRTEDSLLDDTTSVFAVFQYKSVICLYSADAALSLRIHLTAIANTPKNRDWLIEGFFQQLNRHNPVMRRNLEAWLNGHGNSWKESK